MPNLSTCESFPPFHLAPPCHITPPSSLSRPCPSPFLQLRNMNATLLSPLIPCRRYSPRPLRVLFFSRKIWPISFLHICVHTPTLSGPSICCSRCSAGSISALLVVPLPLQHGALSVLSSAAAAAAALASSPRFRSFQILLPLQRWPHFWFRS